MSNVLYKRAAMRHASSRNDASNQKYINCVARANGSVPIFGGRRSLQVCREGRREEGETGPWNGLYDKIFAESVCAGGGFALAQKCKCKCKCKLKCKL